MGNILIASVDYGGYFSLVKLGVFLVLFFGSFWLLKWVNQDSEAVGTDQGLWTGVVFAGIGGGALIWLVVPVFIIGVFLYVLAVGASSLAYVMHRNAKVPQFDKVLTADHIKGLFQKEDKELQELEKLSFVTANNNEVPIPESKTADFFGYKAAYDLFYDGIEKRAEVINLVPAKQQYAVIYRVDGASIKQPAMEREQTNYFVHFVKSVAGLDTGEKRKPQTGNLEINQGKESTQWEVSTAGSTAGEQIKIRKIPKKKFLDVSQLGFTESQFKQIHQLQDTGNGLYIVSGPKKSGTTTTFYTLLTQHDAFLNSISTLEKDPQTDLPNITQEVFSLSDTGTTTYEKKLKQVIRMGPDILGVADCESKESAEDLCQAGREDVLIYVTTEADSVLKALAKWIKMVGNKEEAVKPLLGISNQRLLRKLCDECKQAYSPKPDLLRKFNLPAEKAKVLYRPGKVQYDKRGRAYTCPHCQGTGYYGRIGVFEMILFNEELRKAVSDAKSLSDVNKLFRKAKMKYLQTQALRKVLEGTTAINEMLRMLSAPKNAKKHKGQRKTRTAEQG
ncbi:MAG: Flp pilus assembly complex ATPase component TadA [Planctomycetes bacterium]|nr:Flp pilus assembly complex ATPase component TadA [Planctomycetota bacterium]